MTRTGFGGVSPRKSPACSTRAVNGSSEPDGFADAIPTIEATRITPVTTRTAAFTTHLQPRGGRSSRPGRAVQADRRGLGGGGGLGRAADQRRHQEERADRELQERRQRTRSTGRPILVNTHDFIDEKLGKAIPYGIYDVGRDEGWVSVGISADTAQFAVAAIKAWWTHLGRKRYPTAKTLTITADCGGSNSYRTRLWKTELQHLADQTGLQIRVLHYPPGTSKWNKIEHRLFSYISINWRAKPLVSRQTVIDLIASTTTRTGLKVYARLDPNTYATKIQVTDQQMQAIDIQCEQFHPEWNYTIIPSLIKP